MREGERGREGEGERGRGGERERGREGEGEREGEREGGREKEGRACVRPDTLHMLVKIHLLSHLM